ncbi:MAG: LD-carboxypeptidase [Flavobacteriales bacterium]|nr:LD-carboxypeptidase [Flavobacteriales bacterium]|tara:strand:+ start:1333 stop:2265 length:933 start_codon:yes stop_codon:yes gene_type:complete
MTINNTNSIVPPYLVKGDLIEIIAPARYVTQEDINFSIKLVEKAGFKVKINSSVYQQHNIFGGTLLSRSNNLQNALDNSESKAILFARGGYGTIQIIDKINFIQFKNSPKWLIGFSDITVLLSHIYSVFNIQSIHGPMAFNFKRTNLNNLNALFDVLQGQSKNLKCPSSKFNKTGSASGTLFGGNLSVLCSLIGSRSFPLNDAKIVFFIEDVDEYLYHLERMIYTLDRCGFFNKVQGLIIGEMKNILDNEIKFGKNINNLILDIVDKYDFPVCFDFPFGHNRNNTPLVFGANVKLEVNKFDTNLYFHNEY